MGGEWRIKQDARQSPSGHRVDVIPVTDLGPDLNLANHGIVFTYANGTVVIYPWASIIQARYVPDPADDQ